MAEMDRTKWLNYEDWAKATNNGKTPAAILGKEFDNATTLASRLPIRQATDKFEDKGAFKEPWQKNRNSYVSDPDGVYTPSKKGTYTRSDILGMRKSAVMMEVGQFKQMTAEQQNAFRLDQVKDRFVDIALDAESDMLYANPVGTTGTYDQSTDVRNCLGLAPRYNKITDHNGIYTASGTQRMSPYITLDAGGTGNKLTSVWLIVPSADKGVCRLMPNGTQFTGGIEYNPADRPEWEDGVDAVTGIAGKKQYLIDTFDYVYGIAILNRRSCIRIANIDMTDDTSMAKFINQYRFALAAIDAGLKSANHIAFMNPIMKVYLEGYFDKKVTPSSFADAMPHVTSDGQSRIGIWELSECPQILTTESKIS
jgi:hypothetical protein